MRFTKAKDIKLPEITLPDLQDNDGFAKDRGQAGQQPNLHSRICEAADCQEHGAFPAPRDREALRDYRYFCLEHVREYNKRWNYFSGMQGAALEQAIRDASTWERPSWKFGTSGKTTIRPDDLDDIFGFFDDDVTSTKDAMMDQLDPEERKAWALFGLDPTPDANKVKKRYKELVKIHHPDRHNGDPKAEEKLKEINLAYSCLRNKLATQ